jgi:hypothetical protein
MTESTDLMRRLDAAIVNPSLHPNYARELLREAREALERPAASERKDVAPAEFGTRELPDDTESAGLRRMRWVPGLPLEDV